MKFKMLSLFVLMGCSGPPASEWSLEKSDLYQVEATAVAIPSEAGSAKAFCATSTDVLLNGSCSWAIVPTVVPGYDGAIDAVDSTTPSGWACVILNEGTDDVSLQAYATCLITP